MRDNQLLAVIAAILEAGDRARKPRSEYYEDDYIQRAGALMIQAGGDPIIIRQLVDKKP